MAQQTLSLGQTDQIVNDALSELEKNRAAERLWNKERALFTPDASHDDSVRTRLGWLRSAQLMQENIGRLQAFAQEVQQAGFKKALLLGMGGSSLCPEVLATLFGTRAGALDLRVLDSTDPEAVKAAEQWADLDHTLFIVSSKSGSTIEVASFLSYFWGLTQKRYGAQAGSRFMAITDPGTLLANIATQNGYRAVFENPADIGGRYSAVSYFGMVPAALLGIDLPALVGSAVSMTQSCGAAGAVRDNPGLCLGAFIGGLARSGRDKLTLIASPEVASLGSWIEQLVAESTGKLGKGIVPVDLESLEVAKPGADRAYVYVRLAGEDSTALDAQVERLAAAGQPVATIRLQERTDIGGEFVRWEMATAFASALLGVNPFDEPDVSAAKKATAEFIAQFEQAGSLSFPGWVGTRDAQIPSTLRQAKSSVDYVTLSAFFARTDERDQLLTQVRSLIGAKLGCATTLGYGPRFLHSTGQLHKGGANNGVFLLLRSSVVQDLPIPGQRYSFGILRDAQALGDQKVLLERKRRAVAVNLGENVVEDLAQLLEGLQKSL
jgi:glucose-6-phosphate isomerase